MTNRNTEKPLAGLALTVLGWNVLVVLWGAVVRATGSGAGCGAHWPTCNGSVVPLSPSVETLIEYSHRATSGVALLLVAFLTYRIFRNRSSGHLARFWSAASMLLILSEAAIGAGLVLFRMVAQEESTARGFWISGHLINTFLLLAVLTLTWRFVDDTGRGPRGAGVSVFRATFPSASRNALAVLAFGALLATGISGAIAALGDTLFKAQTLGEALAQDFSPASHLFLRLRILHPIIALAGGGFLLTVAYGTIIGHPQQPRIKRLGLILAGLVVGQWFLGLTNLVLLAPTFLQICHLLMADLILITLVLVAVE